MGQTWPNHVGEARPNPCEQWRCGRDEAGEKRRGEGLTCGGCWRRQAAALAVPSGGNGSVFFVSLSPLFFVLFSASSSSFSFGLPPLLLSLFVLFFFGLPLFSPFLCSPFPCFYRQKTGEKDDGAATVLLLLHRPSNTWKVVGK